MDTIETKLRRRQHRQSCILVQADEDGWDIYWASVVTIKQIFSPDNTVRLEAYQIINHFPNHYELTRKVNSATDVVENCELANLQRSLHYPSI